jgi:glycosyltransferase involved in cell wall biosynthesis
MRIATYIDSALTAGGGFNQALNAILQIASICKGRHEILTFTSNPSNLPILSRLGLDAHVSKPGQTDQWAAVSATNPALRSVQRKLRIRGRLERTFKQHGVDLVYFVDPGVFPLYLQELNYIATVWDICHVDHPEFPEVRENGEFLGREFALQNTLAQAVSVVCDSDELATKLANRYAIDRRRLVPMPFSPSPFSALSSTPTDAVLRKYGLKGKTYYYYPAQLWPHKNHFRILQALAGLRSRGLERIAVFSGKDYGNLAYLQSSATALGIADLVRFLGFLPPEDIQGLYAGAHALVMPTYFGPTNIPPLEAWGSGTPVVYSMHLAEQTGNAAILVDPDSVESLMEGLLQLESPETRRKLIEAGHKRLSELAAKRKAAEQHLARTIEMFASKRANWGRA